VSTTPARVRCELTEPEPLLATIRTPHRISGNSAHALPIGQPTKNVSPAEHSHPAAATHDALLPQPKERAKTNAENAARKNVIDAENVRPGPSGITSAMMLNGSYGAGCAAPARMSPHSMCRFQSGHSRS